MFGLEPMDKTNGISQCWGGYLNGSLPSLVNGAGTKPVEIDLVPSELASNYGRKSLRHGGPRYFAIVN